MSEIASRSRLGVPEYAYRPGSGWDHGYLWPLVERRIRERRPRRIFELGCGNGSVAHRLAALGFDVTAVDESHSGVDQARAVASTVRFEIASAYDDLAARFGRFDLVLSLEVIEHLMSPKTCIERVRDLLQPGGHLLLSTPYHGYLKNLAIALCGRFDSHVNPLWEGGHIKFFSERTIRALLSRAGFTVLNIDRVGRIPPFAKSMLVLARVNQE